MSTSRDQENFPSDGGTELPVTATVNVARWWVGGVMSVVLAVLLTAALVGVPPTLFENPSPMMVFFRILAVVGAPLTVYASWFYLDGAIRPQHVTLDGRGVTTPAWFVEWRSSLHGSGGQDTVRHHPPAG